MVESSSSSIHGVHDAFHQRGFRRDYSREGFHYKGVLDETGMKVPVVVTVDDFDFVRPPLIKLIDHEERHKAQVPHVLRSDGTLCYMDAGAVVLDRYKPAQTIIQCLEHADKVIRDALRGRLQDDIAGELASYWAERVVFVDLPPGFDGDAKIYNLRIGRDRSDELILASNRDSPFFALHKRNIGKDADAGCLCPVIRVPTLYFDPKQSWPPKTLKDLNDWLAVVAPSAVGGIEEAFSRSSRHFQWICLSAPNGRFFVYAELPLAYRKPEFMENRRSALATIIGRIQGTVAISAYAGNPVDEEYVFSRNMGGMKNLAEKRILLVGCGTMIVSLRVVYLAGCHRDGR